jgi:hypothetical protein
LSLCLIVGCARASPVVYLVFTTFLGLYIVHFFQMVCV